MARILSISYDPALLRTRELLLQRMGHRVTSAEGFAQAVEWCDKAAGSFDLVVLGHSIPHEDKRAIIRRCNQTCPCPVLALTIVNEPFSWRLPARSIQATRQLLLPLFRSF